MKKILLVVMAMCLAIAMVGCSSETTGEDGNKKEVIGFITDTGGLGDLGFNDAVHAGVLKAGEEFGVEVKVVETVDQSDYANNMRALLNDGATIISCAGETFKDALITVSSEYPDAKFIVSDINIDGIDNVTTTMFKEQEAAYLLGAFAGLVTKTDKVGYIAGKESPLQERTKVSFEAGFASVNKDGKVTSLYSGTYSDVNKGNDIATSLYTQGNDFVASFSGAVNLGLFKAVNEAGEGSYALGAALGQFELNPEKIMASQVKTVDKAIYTSLSEYLNGSFVPGVVSRGIEAGGVDLLFNPNSELLSTIASDEVLLQIEEIRNQIIAGEIVPPTTEEELETFISNLK